VADLCPAGSPTMAGNRRLGSCRCLRQGDGQPRTEMRPSTRLWLIPPSESGLNLFILRPNIPAVRATSRIAPANPAQGAEQSGAGPAPPGDPPANYASGPALPLGPSIRAIPRPPPSSSCRLGTEELLRASWPPGGLAREKAGGRPCRPHRPGAHDALSSGRLVALEVPGL